MDPSREDEVRWVIDKSNKFSTPYQKKKKKKNSTKSLYYGLTHGVVDHFSKLVWKNKSPLKVRVFLFQMCSITSFHLL